MNLYELQYCFMLRKNSANAVGLLVNYVDPIGVKLKLFWGSICFKVATNK